ncbi:unnamed protein product, partial [Gulo gulo]
RARQPRGTERGAGSAGRRRRRRGRARAQTSDARRGCHGRAVTGCSARISSAARSSLTGRASPRSP